MHEYGGQVLEETVLAGIIMTTTMGDVWEGMCINPIDQDLPNGAQIHIYTYYHVKYS